jgi:rhamnosyltransferase
MTNQLPRKVLAVYNGRQWVEEQIIFHPGQKGIDVTVFISVDLSSDNSEEHDRSDSIKHPGLRC